MNAGGAGESAQERDNAAKCGKRSGKRYTAPIELGFEGGGSMGDDVLETSWGKQNRGGS